MEGGELLGEADLVLLVAQGFAVCFLFHLSVALHGGLRRAVGGDELARAFLADALGAGDVVDGVAHQCHHVGHFLGRDAEVVFHLSFVIEEILGGAEDAHRGPLPGGVGVDQLQHVFVGGDDDGVEVGIGGAAGQRADDVVGLVAFVLQDGQA